MSGYCCRDARVLPKSAARRGTTIVELIAVAACTGLLILLFGAALQTSREDDKAATCLANLHSVAVAAMIYGNDYNESVIPIRPEMQQPSDEWMWKTVHAFAYGGRSATKPMRLFGARKIYLNDVKNQGKGTRGAAYAIKTRGLTLMNYPQVADDTDVEELDTPFYHCPSDTGYPRSPLVQWSPRGNAKKSCYDTLGNSYRANLHALYRDNGEALSLGAWGSSVVFAAREVLFAEPVFFEHATADLRKSGRQLKSLQSWHGHDVVANVAFGDGHCVKMKDMERTTYDENELKAMGLSRANGAYLARGARWQLDRYPIKGRPVCGDWSDSGGFADLDPSQWPFTRGRE